MSPVDQNFGAAISKADFEEAARLLKEGADINRLLTTLEPDERGMYETTTTYLIEAARRGQVQTVRFLMENNANPDIVASFTGQTALITAAHVGHADVVDVLLEYGADFSIVDHPGKFNAIEYAINNENVSIVRSLLAAGAPPTFRRLSFREGEAAAREMVGMLLEHGVDINKRDDWGRTPLMWAAQFTPLETVQFLIDRGADVNIVSGKNMNGVSSNETALQLARKAKRNDVIALLLQHGATEKADFLTRLKKFLK